MQIVTNYPDGVFCWVDLATTDTEAAKSFYGSLFGWEHEDITTDIGTIYTMFKMNGQNVAAVSAMNPETAAQGVPPIWSSYISHSNVDATAEKVTAAGGTVLFPPFDVMDQGRMTVVQDPTGAMVGIWQPKNHIGATLVNQDNALVWNELQTRDTNAAHSFYSNVFGWTGAADENGYVTFSQNGRRHAGMIPMDDNFEGIPAHWAIYFMVDDVDAAAEKVKTLGGSLALPPTPAGDIGKFSVARDPQGGTFCMIQFDGPVDPPPGH